MRTLARFPDHGAFIRLPVELSTQPTAAARRPAAAEIGTTSDDPAAEHDAAAVAADVGGDAGLDLTNADTADFAEGAGEDATLPKRTAGGRVAAFFVTLLAPPRRRRPPKRIGWGSIAFLALIAAGVWTLAWWQSGEEAKRPWEPVPRRFASQATGMDGTVR
jgi:hypothetical protein